MDKPRLLEEIEQFLARPDVSLTETAFGIKVMNDGKFVPDLRNGRRVLEETANKVRSYIRQNSFSADRPANPAQAKAS